MENSDSFSSKQDDLDTGKDVTTKLYHHNNLSYIQSSKLIAIDYLKIATIIVLLIASIILCKYEPPAKTLHETILNQTLNNQSQNYETDEVDDNPYGFHPFYQVHQRVQYKNPNINPCVDIDPKKTLLIAILSRASNVHIREAIRSTWGAPRTYNDIEIRLTFIVGIDDGMLKQIELEQTIYHDVIQINMPENYPVVSYKELATLCWSKYYCSNIQYVFKVDEDIHLNTPLLTRIISEFMKNESLPEIPIMYGWFRHKSRVDRYGRYLVTEEEYPGFYYPPYTFGIGYLLTKAGRDNLCTSAQRPHPVTRVGDAYITGILRDHAMVQHARFVDVHYIYSTTFNGLHCHEYFTYDPKLLICMSSLHSGTNDMADEFVLVWSAIHKDKDNEQTE
ncbi:unnamed protein product [Rotaria sp. Silwood1]|nr:unnamed protein product [Rotaria sp. Silwood1]CAF0861864.1 unnamed protein product [Rotaria sp. Silwood1]CAF3356034.1 unnamed protein product [Rotaria sp. Silwood1]CAF3382986.1 unnamed protein product [Rotaria sp. Silwood1]CAF3387641.1 unnamed protein product [Rotaria sp. Silwood1]